MSPDPAEQVARETCAAFSGILHVDSLSEGDGPAPSYLDLLKRPFVQYGGKGDRRPAQPFTFAQISPPEADRAVFRT